MRNALVLVPILVAAARPAAAENCRDVATLLAETSDESVGEMIATELAELDPGCLTPQLVIALEGNDAWKAIQAINQLGLDHGLGDALVDVLIEDAPDAGFDSLFTALVRQARGDDDAVTRLGKLVASQKGREQGLPRTTAASVLAEAGATSQLATLVRVARLEADTEVGDAARDAVIALLGAAVIDRHEEIQLVKPKAKKAKRTRRTP